MKRRFVVIGLLTFLFLALVAAGAGYWAVLYMPGSSFRGVPSPLSEDQELLRDRLQAHVVRLAGEIGERHYWQPESKHEAARYIEQTFRDAGYEPQRQAVPTREKTFFNIEVTLPGSSRSEEVLVIGAHYDTVRGSHGADDNASGVAVLLELARLLRHTHPERSIRLVAFANEEHPFFGAQAMGSVNHARRAREQNENIVGMISLEMLGYYSREPSSQTYPALLEYFYPDRGDFIAFIGNGRSRRLVHETIGTFRKHAEIPSHGIAAPERLSDIHRSDHWAYWQMGYPAMMLTDTANLRNPHYHSPQDIPATLNYATMARLTLALGRTLQEMN